MKNGNHFQEELAGPENRYDGEEVIDLREYLAIVNKWRGVIVLLTLCAVVTSGIYSYFITSPVYETKTVLMVAQSVSTTDKKSPTNQDNLESVVDTISSIPQLTMNTYVAQVKNNKLMTQVVKALGDKGAGLSAGALLGMVDAQSIKDTNLIEIKASSTNPELAADIANTVQKEFLTFISNNNQVQMTKSIDFLQNQIAVEDKNLDIASNELQRLEGEPRNLTFLQKQIESKYADLGKYQALVNQANYEYQQTLAGRDRLKEQLFNISPTISVNNANGQEEINQGYTSLNDALVRKEMDLAEKAAQFEAANGLVVSLEGDIRVLQAEISEKKLTMDRLTTTLEQAKNTYNILNEKRIQTNIMQAVNLGESYLLPVSPAPVPTSPVKPNKKLNMAIAGILGLMVSAMLAFLLEFLDNTIKDSEDIRKIFNLTVVGNIPIFDDGDSEKKNKHKKRKIGHGEEHYAWEKAIT